RTPSPLLRDSRRRTSNCETPLAWRNRRRVSGRSRGSVHQFPDATFFDRTFIVPSTQLSGIRASTRRVVFSQEHGQSQSIHHAAEFAESRRTRGRHSL